MLVTKTEMFTDWSYEGAHMGEQAATVGRGLMSGHIYFRYAYDFLQDGETIKREMSFIELSDGSTYELGTGACASKITVIDHGLTSGGEVYIEVIGKPEVGVGVSRILRHVTIEYDDGKVPVLDTDQLDEVLKQLSDGLTQSMIDTANAVKQEVNARIDTAEITLEQKCNTAVASMGEAVRAELDESVQGLQEDLDDWVSSAGSTHNRFTQDIETLKQGVSTLEDSAATIKMVRYDTPGRYTINNGVTTNLLVTPPTEVLRSDAMAYNAEHKTIKVTTGASPRVRLLRVTLTAGIDAGDLCDGNIYLSLRNSNDAMLVQSLWPVTRSKLERTTERVQFSLEMIIDANSTTHPALTNGIRVVAFNRTGGNIVFLTEAMITAQLTTI